MKPSPISRINIAFFVVLSLLAHIAGARLISRYGDFDFTLPISADRIISLDLKSEFTGPGAATASKPSASPTLWQVTPSPEPDSDSSCVSNASYPATPFTDETKQPAIPVVEKRESENPADPLKSSPAEHDITQDKSWKIPAKPKIVPPHRKVSEFLSAYKEKLSYQISLYGVPIGSALLEATNNKGELRIVSTARSNDAFSVIYLVDNRTETRIISGNYIMTTIRQNEGSYKSDTGFTLMIPEKKVFWADRIRRRYREYTVKDADALDIITGIYFIRKQPIEVGKSIILKLFDSSSYAPTPIEVLRRETIILAGEREVETLVIHPLLKTEGFFRRTGDIMIWLTDDENRVPVRLETTIPLGKISVDLVSAEVVQREDDTSR